MTIGVSIASFQTQATSWAIGTNPEYDHATTTPIRYGMSASASDSTDFSDYGRTSRLFTQLFGPSQDSLTSMTLKLAKAPPTAVDPLIPPSRPNILSTLYDDPAFSPDPRSNPLFVMGHDSVWVSPAPSALIEETQNSPPADICPTHEKPQPQQPPTSLMTPKELHYLKQDPPPAPTPHLDSTKHGVSNVTQSTKPNLQSRAVYAEPVPIPQKKKTINLPFLRRMSLSTTPPKPDTAHGIAHSTLITPSARIEGSTRPDNSRNNTAPELRTTPTRPSLPPRPATTSVKIKAPKGLRRMFESNRTKAPQLDKIDELDETNPLGLSLHHGGPYEALRHLTFQGPPKRAVPYNVGSQYAATPDKHQNYSIDAQHESGVPSEVSQKLTPSPPRPLQHDDSRAAPDKRQRRMSSDFHRPVVSQKPPKASPPSHIPVGAPLSISPGQILPPNFQPYSQMHLGQWSDELLRSTPLQNTPSPLFNGNQSALQYHQHGQSQWENPPLQQSYRSHQEQHYPVRLPLAQPTTMARVSPSDQQRIRHYSMPTRNPVSPYPTTPLPLSHDGTPSPPPPMHATPSHEPRNAKKQIARRVSLVVSVPGEDIGQATQETGPQSQHEQHEQAQPSVGSRPIRGGSPPNDNQRAMSQVTSDGYIDQEQRSEHGYKTPGEQRPLLAYHNSQVQPLVPNSDSLRVTQISGIPPSTEGYSSGDIVSTSDTQGRKEIVQIPQHPQHPQPQRHLSRDTQSIQQSVTNSSNSGNSNRPRHQSRFAPKRLVMPAPLQSSMSVNTGSSPVHPGSQMQARPYHDSYHNYPPQSNPQPQFRQQQAPPPMRGTPLPSRTPSLPAAQAKDIRIAPQTRKLQKRASMATPSDTSSVISPKAPLSFAPTPSYSQVYAPPPLAHSKSEKVPKRLLSKRRNDM